MTVVATISGLRCIDTSQNKFKHREELPTDILQPADEVSGKDTANTEINPANL